jgi:hypothetical protein
MTRHPSACILALLTMAGLSSGRAAAQDLGTLYRVQDSVSQAHVEYHQVDIAPGKEVPLGDLDGPGKVTYFYITDNTNGRFYPGLVLKIFWDGEAQPSVAVPLSDFFGAMADKTIDYQSTPMQINHFCYMCYLPMPFSKHARFVLANDGDKKYSQSMAWGIDYEKGAQFAQEKSRLHACWRRSNPTRDAVHTIVEISGRGHYVGNFLQVHSKYKDWWGEGDTIFQLDGKKITHTPGTEDEYGSCWCFGHTFSYQTCGYIQMDKEDHRMYRWYLANPVRFQKSLKVEIQNQRYENEQVPSRDDYTSVAYWYQDSPKPVALQPYAERVAPSKAASYTKP